MSGFSLVRVGVVVQQHVFCLTFPWRSFSMPCWEVACHVLSPKAVFRKSLANFARLSADAVQIDSWVLHLEGEMFALKTIKPIKPITITNYNL